MSDDHQFVLSLFLILFQQPVSDMETSINLELDSFGEDDDDDLPAVTRLPGLDEDDDRDNFLNTSGQRNEGRYYTRPWWGMSS